MVSVREYVGATASAMSRRVEQSPLVAVSVVVVLLLIIGVEFYIHMVQKKKKKNALKLNELTQQRTKVAGTGNASSSDGATSLGALTAMNALQEIQKQLEDIKSKVSKTV